MEISEKGRSPVPFPNTPLVQGGWWERPGTHPLKNAFWTHLAATPGRWSWVILGSGRKEREGIGMMLKATSSPKFGPKAYFLEPHCLPVVCWSFRLPERSFIYALLTVEFCIHTYTYTVRMGINFPVFRHPGIPRRHWRPCNCKSESFILEQGSMPSLSKTGSWAKTSSKIQAGFLYGLFGEQRK